MNQQQLNHVQPLFPPGIRFTPTDEELIVEYLKKKINNQPYADVCIFSVDFYQYNPWELTVMYPTIARDEWYFFTSRERKYPNGTLPSRAAGDGYWKATVADQCISSHGSDCIGFKKTLVFFTGKSPKAKKTNWIMHEYTVPHPPKPTNTNGNMRLEEYVLCRIHERKPAAAVAKNHKHLRIENENHKEVYLDLDTGDIVDHQPDHEHSRIENENYNEIYFDLETGDIVDHQPDDSIQMT